jgi:hypothetical protein
MTEEDIKLKAQSSLQEYEDAVENLAPNYAELGQKAIIALDELIKHWSDKPYMQSGRQTETSGEDAELREYAERLINWANEEKAKVLAELSKRSSK